MTLRAVTTVASVDFKGGRTDLDATNPVASEADDADALVHPHDPHRPARSRGTTTESAHFSVGDGSLPTAPLTRGSAQPAPEAPAGKRSLGKSGVAWDSLARTRLSLATPPERSSIPVSGPDGVEGRGVRTAGADATAAAAVADATLFMVVKDSGSGISQAMQRTLLQPFSKVRSSRALCYAECARQPICCPQNNSALKRALTRAPPRNRRRSCTAPPPLPWTALGSALPSSTCCWEISEGASLSRQKKVRLSWSVSSRLCPTPDSDGIPSGAFVLCHSAAAKEIMAGCDFSYTAPAELHVNIPLLPLRRPRVHFHC